jgi:hypothetical protein
VELEEGFVVEAAAWGQVGVDGLLVQHFRHWACLAGLNPGLEQGHPRRGPHDQGMRVGGVLDDLAFGLTSGSDDLGQSRADHGQGGDAGSCRSSNGGFVADREGSQPSGASPAEGQPDAGGDVAACH